MSIEPAVSRFEGARIRFDSPLGFDRVLERLRTAITPLPLAEFNKVVAASDSQEAFEAAMGRCVGASGFVLFGEIDHGAWIAKYGIRRRALRWIFGNPLIAITMLRHDLQAGLTRWCGGVLSTAQAFDRQGVRPHSGDRQGRRRHRPSFSSFRNNAYGTLRRKQLR